MWFPFAHKERLALLEKRLAKLYPVYILKVEPWEIESWEQKTKHLLKPLPPPPPQK